MSAAELVLLTWPDYIAPENLAAFEAESGVRVRLEVVPSAVEMVERVRRGPPVDVLAPPDYAVRELAAEGRLLQIDRAALPNAANLAPEFVGNRPHDVGDRFSVPKDWGTTGYLLRKDRVERPATAWADFWRLAAECPGKACVLDSPGEVIGAALKMRGGSYNSVDPEDLARARDDLLALRPHLLAFETDYKPLLASARAWLALGWNGDAVALRRMGHPIRYVLPAEGSQTWEDDWAIASDSSHPAEAHSFLDFMLRPEVAAVEAAYTGYATPNRAALGLLPVEARQDVSTYPPPNLRTRLEHGLPLEAEGARLRAEIWREVRGA